MKVNVERDIDVKQLLINLDSKSQCKSVGMAGYEVLVDKQMLRDAHDVIAQFMKERYGKTLAFAELEDEKKASGYYSAEEAGKALKKAIEKVNEEENCTVDNKGVPEHLQQKCDECFFKDYELCECTNNSGSGFCPFRPLCFMNYGRDNISKCIGCTFGEECEWKSNKKAPSKKEPKLRKEIV